MTHWRTKRVILGFPSAVLTALLLCAGLLILWRVFG